MRDFLVVGGGIIGLLLTRKLAEKGVKVTLIDRQEFGKESSWAGGGILSPMFPWRYSDALNELVDWNAVNFRTLSNVLYEETGIDPELSLGGINMLDAHDQKQALHWSYGGGGSSSGLTGSSVNSFLAREPLFADMKDLRSVLTLPHLGSIRNPRLLQALENSLELNRNVEIKRYCEARSVIRNGSEITGIVTNQGTLSAGECVFTTGAWSGDLLKELDAGIAISPVKGQMLLLRADPGVLNSVVLTEDCYMIPRKDGRILIGSTVEHCGYDKTPTSEAKEKLLSAAIKLAPGLARFPLEKHWAGLRPSSPTGVPYIGRVKDLERISVCAGHFRNGVVTAPYSVDKLVNMLL